MTTKPHAPFTVPALMAVIENCARELAMSRLAVAIARVPMTFPDGSAIPQNDAPPTWHRVSINRHDGTAVESPIAPPTWAEEEACDLIAAYYARRADPAPN